MRDAAVRRAIGGAAPQAARETGPRRPGANQPRQTDRVAGADPAWSQPATGPAPVAFGTPSPYDGPAVDELRRSAPALPAMQSGPLSGVLAAQVLPMAGGYDSLTEPTRPARRGRLVIILSAVLIAIAAGLAFAIPMLTRGAEEPARAPAAAAPSEPAGPSPSSAPAASQVTNPVTTSEADPAAPEPADSAESGAESAAPAEATDPPPSRDREVSGDAPSQSSEDRGGSDRDEPGRGAAKAAGPVRVRVVSRPVGELYAAGRRGALCETPCALTINPGDGGSAQRRVYVIKRPGYKDETITIDLAEPPSDVRVELQKLRVPGRGRQGSETGDDDSKDEGESEADEAGEPGAADPDSTFNPFSDPSQSEP